MAVFPSVEWFETVAARVNADPAYRALGTCDAQIGVQVGSRLFAISFEAFDVTGVREVPVGETPDLDFTLVLPYDGWRTMLSSIRQHGRADRDQTLNTLDLAAADEFARSDDYYRRDIFYRFNQSFQHFFDASAAIETEFADPAAVG